MFAFRFLTVLTILSVLSLASLVLADENLAGDGTVAEWRANLGRSQLATAACAAGVMAMGNISVVCKTPRAVRELHEYLRYRALPTLTMKQAIWSFLTEGDCNVRTEDQPASASVPRLKFTSPSDSAEY